MHYASKLLGICFLLGFLSCKNSERKAVNKSESLLESNCQIPVEIDRYLKEHVDQWSAVELSDFNEELVSYLRIASQRDKSDKCPYFILGDFTNDGKEDCAIILRNKTYKVDEYGEYKFPFLLVFNDYKKSVEPNVVYKTGEYKNEAIKTVILSEQNDRILSYLSNGNICGTKVIDVNYFEKSGFFVYWDQQSNSYQFLNYLDEGLCEKVTATNNTLSSSVNSESLSFYEKNDAYFITTIDINNDNILDKVVSSKPYHGDELLLFVNRKNAFELALKTTNFSEDGGNQLTGIKKHQNGFVITTAFPDRGFFESNYYVTFQNNSWILTHSIYKTEPNQQDASFIYVCEVKQNLDMSNPGFLDQLKWMPDESDREKMCSKVSK